MKCFITLGTINKYITFAIIGGIFKLIPDILLFDVETNINSHPFILSLNSGLGMCLSLFPFIIEKIISKPLEKKDANNEENKLLRESQYSEHLKKIKYFKYLLILASGALDFLQRFLVYYFLDEVKSNFWIFDVIFLSLFSYFILKTKLYIHQYISLLAILFLGVVQNIINLYDKAPNIGKLIAQFSAEVVFTFNIVLNKYEMEKYFCSPFEISFYQGLFVLILNIILLAFTKEDNFFDYYDNLDYKELWVFILFMFSKLSFNIFGLLTNKYFTPCHVNILLIIGQISFSFKYKNDYKLYLTAVIFCFVLFLLLVFTEIIELNFCGLQQYTKKNITERSIRQTLLDSKNEFYDDLMSEEERNSPDSRNSSSSTIEIDGYSIEMKNDFRKKKNENNNENNNCI